MPVVFSSNRIFSVPLTRTFNCSRCVPSRGTFARARFKFHRAARFGDRARDFPAERNRGGGGGSGENPSELHGRLRLEFPSCLVSRHVLCARRNVRYARARGHEYQDGGSSGAPKIFRLSRAMFRGASFLPLFLSLS